MREVVQPPQFAVPLPGRIDQGEPARFTRRQEPPLDRACKRLRMPGTDKPSGDKRLPAFDQGCRLIRAAYF